MKIRTLLAVTLLTTLVAASGFAQAVVSRANVPFAFSASSKSLPAGVYTLTFDSGTNVFRVVGVATGAETLVPVETRLAAGMHTTPNDSHLVFDKVGDKYFLSEVWIPGLDGFLLYMTKGAHEHAVINVPVGAAPAKK